MSWNDKRHELTIGERQGSYPEMLKTRNFRVVIVGDGAGLGLDNEKHSLNVRYDGSKIKVKF